MECALDAMMDFNFQQEFAKLQINAINYHQMVLAKSVQKDFLLIYVEDVFQQLAIVLTMEEMENANNASIITFWLKILPVKLETKDVNLM